jgi:hypothetical protein
MEVVLMQPLEKVGWGRDETYPDSHPNLFGGRLETPIDEEPPSVPWPSVR